MKAIRRGWKAALAMTTIFTVLLTGVIYPAETETETESQKETIYKEAKVMYLTDTVRVRAGADAESETVAFADRGDALTVVGELDGWYHVRLDDPEAVKEAEPETEVAAAKEADAGDSVKEGFVKGTYLTENKDEAEQAVAANDAEIRRKEAEAAAAAAAAASARGGGGGGRRSKKKSGKTVTGTQNVDDCDGSGHGTTITTYSDGSTSTSRY